MTEDREFWYRYDDKRWSVTLDAEMEIYGTRLEVMEHKYEVLRHTPKGAWLQTGYLGDRNERWVGLGKGKRFAYPTKEEALVGYIARKTRQIQIYEARLAQALEFRGLARQKMAEALVQKSSGTPEGDH